MNEHYPFVNPPLPYAYDAMEPYIDTLTMHLHHDRHLQTYVDNLNKALADSPALQSWSLEQLLTNPGLPAAVQTPIKNNGGGVYNHIFYFNGLSNSETRHQAGALHTAIVRDFGSVEKFFEAFKKEALAVFGSGYAWLVTDKNGKLSIIKLANQDTPIAKGLCPVATIDVWEHAYYLKHYNERAKYIDDWFQVANWERAGELYRMCTAGRTR
jgi:Fe-Mn family superoxide dismutase